MRVKGIYSYLNLIGFSIIIILMGINEYVLDKTSINRMLLNIIIFVLGICMIIINVKKIISK